MQFKLLNINAKFSANIQKLKELTFVSVKNEMHIF
jgi:hypothetical protein